MNEISKSTKWIGTSPVRPDGVPKVTGLARFGDDFHLPGMLQSKVVRSPHAHARIRSIDTSKAEAVPGVKAVITGADFPELPFVYFGPARIERNMWHMTRTIMAQEKALFEGHAVAAVAATTAPIAAKAAKLIEIDYEVLPHVIDVDEAMAEDAPVLFEDMITRGVEPVPTKPSNVSKVTTFEIGDVAAGFAEADEIAEHDYRTAPVHQGYIEPHACLARYDHDGQCELWSSSQGHFIVRDFTSKICGMPLANLKVNPAEIGGGFGGKTVVYVEPIAVILSKKSGQPVRVAMTREDVFKASGPTSGASIHMKIGAKKDGTITAAEGVYKYQAGAFPGSPVIGGALCGFSPYAIANEKATAYDVVSNRPKVAAYRAPGSPIAAFAVESTLDILAKKIGMDPAELRLKNAARKGTKLLSGESLGHDGYASTIKAIRDLPDYDKPLGPNQGRGVASGYWFNGGGESGATVYVNADGTIVVATGSPDIGGSRASMAMMAAETIGIDYEQVRATVNDTTSVPYTQQTGGSRVTYATGLAVIGACNRVIEELKVRAAKMWDVDPDGVKWEDGEARPAGSNVGDFDPLSLKDIASKAVTTGGPIGSTHAVAAGGQAPGYASELAEVEVDLETGLVKILRFVVAQDAGQAIHKGYVEGQMQGGAVQGIGWALNEEYVYDDKGRQTNAGFLDYRIPVASDLTIPIETLIVEVPNPNHPFGVKGVGEANIVPAMAAIANAVADAVGRRMDSLPMSPPKMLAALKHREGGEL